LGARWGFDGTFKYSEAYSGHPKLVFIQTSFCGPEIEVLELLIRLPEMIYAALKNEESNVRAATLGKVKRIGIP
jgi:hypothetical protein